MTQENNISDIDKIRTQLESLLGSLPANTESIQIMVYGFTTVAHEVNDTTSPNFESIISSNLESETRLFLLKGNIDQLLIDAVQFNDAVISETPAEELEPVRKQFKKSVNRLRINLNDFADNLETREVVKEYIKDIYITLLQSKAQHSWNLVNTMFLESEVKLKKKDPISLKNLNELVTAIQWELASANTKPIKRPLSKSEEKTIEDLSKKK